MVLFAQTPAPNPAPNNAEFVIRNVRIFDGSEVIAQGQVWVQKGRIKAVGTDVKAPTGIPSINGEGETLLPGLIDAHTHAFGSALEEALIFGVTTELDMFTSREYASQIKQEQADGKDLDLADCAAPAHWSPRRTATGPSSAFPFQPYLRRTTHRLLSTRALPRDPITSRSFTTMATPTGLPSPPSARKPWLR
jgi:predicted amidohydrolase YtcJ